MEIPRLVSSRPKRRDRAASARRYHDSPKTAPKTGANESPRESFLIESFNRGAGGTLP